MIPRSLIEVNLSFYLLERMSYFENLCSRLEILLSNLCGVKISLKSKFNMYLETDSESWLMAAASVLLPAEGKGHLLSPSVFPWNYSVSQGKCCFRPLPKPVGSRLQPQLALRKILLL